MIEKVPSEELDSWREHPVTRAFRAELKTKRRRIENGLYRAAVDQPLDYVRKVAGMLELLGEVETLIETTGEDD